MDEREYLVKAQEADSFANAATDSLDRQIWERIAKEYRRLALTVAAMRRGDPFIAFSGD